MQVGYYGEDGSTDLWAFTWIAPATAELAATENDGFVVEIRRRSNNAILVQFHTQGTNHGNYSTLSELRVR